MKITTKILKGPKGLPLIGNLFQFAKENRLDWLIELQKEFGNIYPLKVANENFVVIGSPEMTHYILAKNADNYSKESAGLRVVRPIIGNGLFSSEGAVWSRQRRLMQPAFHRNQINELGQLMIATVEEMTEDWEKKYALSNTPFNIANEMMRLTLDIVTRCMFSSSLTKKEIDEVADLFPKIMVETERRIFFPFKITPYIPAKHSRNYLKNIAALDAIIYKILKERKQQASPGNDLLGMLLTKKDAEDGKGMTLQQLRDELITIFLAGHETTSNALAWTWVMLQKHPQIHQKLKEEIQTNIGQRTTTASDYKNLPYTQLVLKETLRLYPPLPMFIRCAIEDDYVDGYLIKKGTRILLCPYLLHRDENVWEDALAFKPERFDKKEGKQRHIFSYLPFGGGPRLCIGNHFAMMEAVLAIAVICQKFDMTILSQKVEALHTLTLSPKNGVQAKIKKKKH